MSNSSTIISAVVLTHGWYMLVVATVVFTSWFTLSLFPQYLCLGTRSWHVDDSIPYKTAIMIICTAKKTLCFMPKHQLWHEIKTHPFAFGRKLIHYHVYYWILVANLCFAREFGGTEILGFAGLLHWGTVTAVRLRLVRCRFLTAVIPQAKLRCSWWAAEFWLQSLPPPSLTDHTTF